MTPTTEAASGETGINLTPTAAGTGLASADAARLLIEHGVNELEGEQATSPFALIARQFASPVI